MRLLISSMNVTLDGCCDHTEVIADEALHRYAADVVCRKAVMKYNAVETFGLDGG